MIYIYASHYSWMTSDLDAAYAFTSFLESMGYEVKTKIDRSISAPDYISITSLN